MEVTQELNKSLLGNDTPLLIDPKVHGGRDPFGGPVSLLLGTPGHHLGCAFYEIVLHTACKAQALHLSSGKPLNNNF